MINDTVAANTANGGPDGAGGGGGAGGSSSAGGSGVSGGATGGGVYAGGGDATLVNNTIADNAVASSGTGGGMDVIAGAVTLDNTIVSLNTNGTGGGAPADDITGTVSSASAYNLIGTGGAGGLTDGSYGNEVGLTNLGLGTLANNGGSTQTIALLPGSPAIGHGSATIAGVTVPTTDQRGVARPSNSVDIGAFQDRGFAITVVTGESPQTAAINTAFANPLAVFVMSPFGDPVKGGTVTFTVTPSGGGASASLSAGSATVGAGGLASVTAVANDTVGSYTATASVRGVATTAVFALSNLGRAVSVAGVSVGWGTQTVALQTAADGIRLLPAGRNTDLPWLGINKLPITLAQAATLTAADVTVSSAIGASYGPLTITGSGTSYTINLANPITKPDRVTITIGSATIATFSRRLDVLPGDFNDDGVVNGPDVVGVHNEWLRINGAVPTIFGDINGDGVVNVTDYNDVRKQIGTVLPSVSDPPIALAPASQGGAALVQIAAVPPSVSTTSTAVAPASESGPEVVQMGTVPPSVSDASTTVVPARQAHPEVVQIGTSTPSRPTVASRAHPRVRAEIQLSGRGSRLGTLTTGKMVHQPLIERTYQDASNRLLHDDSRQHH